MKEYNYMKALRALRESRNTNHAQKDAFNSLISGLKKKNQCWDIGCQFMCILLSKYYHVCDELSVFL